MAEVEFRIECLPEYTMVRGNAMATGDDDMDRAYEDRILKALDQGDQWAWCCVKVTAYLKGFEGTTYLGCCSYTDEDEFKQGGYYEDMKAEALRSLMEKLERAKKALEELEEVTNVREDD